VKGLFDPCQIAKVVIKIHMEQKAGMDFLTPSVFYSETTRGENMFLKWLMMPIEPVTDGGMGTCVFQDSSLACFHGNGICHGIAHGIHVGLGLPVPCFSLGNWQLKQNQSY
jgi:hypothetical protein